MRTEDRLVEFIRKFSFEEIPNDVLTVVKNVILNVCGTIVAGAKEEGIKTLYDYYRRMGGIPEATVFRFNDRLPAENSALINGAMARALDFCDAMVPGLHMGSTAIPCALAASELVGYVSGKEFVTAVTVGLEVGSRLNLSEKAYDGFDPTGVVSTFVGTSVAARLLRLEHSACLNALGLAFNRSGGSFQSNIDGTLAVRVIQGWTAQTGIMCARYAKEGITGPKNFLGGIYGFYHLYGKDLFRPEDAIKDIGESFLLKRTVFKKYPACGAIQSSVEAILNLKKEHEIEPSYVDRIEIEVTPYVFRLVGHEFKIGDNPRVDAQFSLRYCVASALTKGSLRLEDFEEKALRDPSIGELIQKIQVTPKSELDYVDHTAVRVKIICKDKKEYFMAIDIAPGFPGNPLSDEEHVKRFLNLADYAKIGKDRAERIIDFVKSVEKKEDVGELIGYLSH